MGAKVHQMGAATAPIPLVGIAPATTAAHETPASKVPGVEVVEVAGKPRAYVKDRRGRRIGVRLMEILDQYRLAKVLGDQSQNFGAVNLATAAVSVVEIDGEAVSFPGRESELEMIMSRLGQDGIAAVVRALPALAEAEADEGAIKN